MNDQKVERALRDLTGSVAPATGNLDDLVAQTGRRVTRARVTSVVTVIAALLFAVGAGAMAVASSRTPAQITAAAGACKPTAANTKITASSAKPGTTVTASGPIYYLGEDGSVIPNAPTAAVQIWWGVDESNWTSVIVQGAANAAANSGDTTGSVEGPFQIAHVQLSGTCSFSVPFVVPDVPPGAYPVGVVYATDTGISLYSSLTLKVT